MNYVANRYYNRIFPLRVHGATIDKAISLDLNVSEAMRAGLDLAIENRLIQKGASNGTKQVVEKSIDAGKRQERSPVVEPPKRKRAKQIGRS